MHFPHTMTPVRVSVAFIRIRAGFRSGRYSATEYARKTSAFWGAVADRGEEFANAVILELRGIDD